jgi:hypothetical protein
MTWNGTDEMQERMWNILYRGTNGAASTSNYLILLDNPSLTGTSTVSNAVVSELLESDGYERVLFNPGAPTTTFNVTGFPTADYDFPNNGTSSISYDSVALIYGGSSHANSTVTSIASDTITSTAHNNSDDDRVLFTNSSGSAPSGITLSTTSSVTNYFVINASTNTFQIATSVGGSAISLGTVWTGMLVVRNANGTLGSYDSQLSPVSISAGQTSTVTVSNFEVFNV